MKCYYCHKKEAVLMWLVYQVCQECYDKLMKRKLSKEQGEKNGI